MAPSDKGSPCRSRRGLSAATRDGASHAEKCRGMSGLRSDERPVQRTGGGRGSPAIQGNAIVRGTAPPEWGAYAVASPLKGAKNAGDGPRSSARFNGLAVA